MRGTTVRYRDDTDLNLRALVKNEREGRRLDLVIVYPDGSVVHRDSVPHVSEKLAPSKRYTVVRNKQTDQNVTEEHEAVIRKPGEHWF